MSTRRGTLPGGVGRLLAALAVCMSLVAAACGDAPPAPTPRPASPQLSCPASFTITAMSGAPEAVFYPDPVLTRGTTPVTIACTPGSGTTFQPGATPVTCRATDAFNQVGTCTFSVTLRALTLGTMTFVAFGDSVTEGENALFAGDGGFIQVIDTPNAYPTRLQAMLQAQFPGQGATVVNAGRSGEKATAGVDRLPEVLDDHRPGALLLLDGYNDLLAGGTAAVPSVVDALEDMTAIAKGAGVQYVLLSTVTPGRPGLRQISPSAILQVNTQIRSLAASDGAILVDNFNTFVGREATLVSDDGLHLTAAGNQVLADTFLAAIKAAVANDGSLSGNR